MYKINVLARIVWGLAFVFAGVVLLGGSNTTEANVVEQATIPTSISSYDVVVVGAGSGGISAAITAARQGLSLLLIEETDVIGGQTIAAGVTSMDGNLNNPSGIWKEFADRVRAYYVSKGLSITTCYWATNVVCFEPHVGKTILTAMINETGRITIKTRTTISSVITSGNKVTGLITKFGDTINAKQVIEATEYGDLLPLISGLSYRVGNIVTTGSTLTAPDPKNICVQAITYTATVKKYPLGVPANLKINEIPDPATYPASVAKFRSVVTNTGNDISTWKAPYNWSSHVGYRGQPNEKAGLSYTQQSPTERAKITKTSFNWANDYPYSVYDLDPANRKTANCAAKMHTLQFIYYVQNELKQPWSVADDEIYDTAYNRADNNCANIPSAMKEVEARMPVEPYIREGRRGIGMVTVTAKDIQRDTQTLIGKNNLNASIATGDYAFDLHGCSEQATLESSLGEVVGDNNGVSGTFQVPLGALIPQSIDGLIFAEKNISTSRMAAGATRLQPITMLTGQAAGTLAAIAIKTNRQPRQVKANEVQALLLDNKSATARSVFSDIPLNYSFWKQVQFVNTYGIFGGLTDGLYHPVDVMTRAQMAVVVAKRFNLPIVKPVVPTFIDVPTTHYAYAYIEAITKAGLLAGCANTPTKKFCPEVGTTRSQMAVPLALSHGYNGWPSKLPSFTDVPTTYYAYGHIEYVKSKNLMAGCSTVPSKFCPDTALTRIDATTALSNSLQIYGF